MAVGSKPAFVGTLQNTGSIPEGRKRTQHVAQELRSLLSTIQTTSSVFEHEGFGYSDLSSEGWIRNAAVGH